MHFLKKLYYFYLKKKKPQKYARKIGVTIGENCKFIGSPNWGSEPWLITIGNHTEVSFDVAFITHDGATWVFRNQEKYRGTLKFGRIKIGNNCFIGARSTILPGVEVGDNCIVAAGSVVTKSIPYGEIWGGNPAHFISKTTVYAEKCYNNRLDYDRENFLRNKREEVERMLKNNHKVNR